MARYHHGHVQWLYVPEPGVWHGRDDETGMSLCGTAVPDTTRVIDQLPDAVVASARANIFESRLCAACARVVKLHRG